MSFLQSWSIADIQLNLQGQRDTLSKNASVFDPFRDSSRPPTESISFSAEIGSPKLSDDAELVFDSEGIWKMYRSTKGWEFLFQTETLGKSPYKLACLDTDFTNGHIIVSPQPQNSLIDPLEYPLDEIVFVLKLLRIGGAEFHACGLVDEEKGKGHLFIGNSGFGKTTTAKLWEQIPGCRILSDDRVAIKFESGKAWMYGTPWHGEAELADNSRVLLTHLWFLARGENNRLVPISQTEAMAKLLCCTFLFFHSDELKKQALRAVESLCNAVDQYATYQFRPDMSAVHFLRNP